MKASRHLTGRLTPIRSDSSGEKNSTHYPKYHEAGYRYAYDTGNKSVLDHDRHFQEVVEGELEEVQYYEGRISK